MKTQDIIITIPNSVSEEIFRIIRINQFAFTIIGINQSNQLVLKLTCSESNQSSIEEMYKYMKQVDNFSAELKAVINPLMKKIKDTQAEEDRQQREVENAKWISRMKKYTKSENEEELDKE